MDIKYYTSKMLSCISARENERSWIQGKNNVKDKDIAKELKLSAVNYSKLKTRVCKPRIETWLTILKKYKQVTSKEEFNNLIDEMIC